ncbi:hypothetical protein KR032_007583 [Drosophila birchii]|nr:hypothetical protein KR032_007583 [Drosophila birchii]
MESEFASQKKKVTSSNFEKFGSKSLYFEINRRMNWFAAGNTCRSMGGHLINIRDSQELNEMFSYQNYSSNKHYWIDINDLAQEDQYVSSFSGRDAPFTKWAVTEPNDFNDVEDCVDLYNLEMYDNNCQNRYYFICQEDNDSCI